MTERIERVMGAGKARFSEEILESTKEDEMQARFRKIIL